ncbi:CHAD domain-containing protein [Myxosarcina sp. GI1]|uniref:CHAD domain-containing protein n=1 Tax=Myxosarcina sp. GI1 TaxID=1541065 RepID=UPI0006907FCA|nr:CHAD domain-containing protein [Myxosarcina sp. GI1]
MPYKLKEGESISTEIKRIISEQIDKATEELTVKIKDDRDEAIHDARKRFKKIRAVIRLVRDDLDKKTYKKENACFRDAGRRLSGVRDAEVLSETLESLEKHFQEYVNPEAFGDLEQILTEHYKLMSDRVFEQQDAVSEVVTDIKEAKERINNWSLDNDWSVLGAGLKRIYQHGYQDARGIFNNQPTVENLHEWRKQVKYLWYHLKILHPVWSDLLEQWVKQSHQLADYLGDDHDLAVLGEFIDDRQEELASNTEIAILSSLIDRRREQLQLSAQWLGQKIYVEKPKAFVGRLGDYWHIWQRETAISSRL